MNSIKKSLDNIDFIHRVKELIFEEERENNMKRNEYISSNENRANIEQIKLKYGYIDNISNLNYINYIDGLKKKYVKNEQNKLKISKNNTISYEIKEDEINKKNPILQNLINEKNFTFEKTHNFYYNKNLNIFHNENIENDEYNNKENYNNSKYTNLNDDSETSNLLKNKEKFLYEQYKIDKEVPISFRIKLLQNFRKKIKKKEDKDINDLINELSLSFQRSKSDMDLRDAFNELFHNSDEEEKILENNINTHLVINNKFIKKPKVFYHKAKPKIQLSKFEYYNEI